jgi:hypothetical protein
MAIKWRIKARVNNSNSGHKIKHLTFAKSVREKCLDCSCWQSNEIRLCPIMDCALYVFRFGRNPTEKELSEWTRNYKEIYGIDPC